MHFLKKIFVSVCLLSAATAQEQKASDKPAAAKNPAAQKSPAEAIVGLWHGTTPSGEEFITFIADGRAVMQRGPGEAMSLTYKLDATAQPWKLDLTVPSGDNIVTVYTVLSLNEQDELAMAPPAGTEAKRPDAAALKDAKVKMTRIKLAAHEGIYQVVEAFLKKLSGTWEGKDGGETVTLTFTAGGEYTMKVAGFTDHGRFRINVTKMPVAIDLLSSEGAGVKYSIAGFTPEGDLKVGNATVKPAERQAAFDDISAKTYKKKEAAPEPPKK